MADDEAFRRGVLAMGPVIGSRITFSFLFALACIMTAVFLLILVMERDGYFAPHVFLGWTIVMVSWLARGSYRLLTGKAPDP